MAFILNNFTDINTFPHIWSVAQTSSNPKLNQPKDHRRVSTLPVPSKIYERVVLEQVIKFIGEKLMYDQY